MGKLIDEIVYDVKYIRDHNLQPQWYKYGKVLIILGFLLLYYLLFAWQRTIIFAGLFFALSAIVHLLYRIKTEKFTKSWLDFRVREENGKYITERIGEYYYLFIISNTIISIVISQLVFN
jgi:uncharacterized membrane protein HdeD (DUF308 family)